MIEINSRANDHIKELYKLQTKKYRDLKKMFLVEGFHLVEMAKDYLVEVLVTNVESIPSYVNKDIVTLVNKSIIEKLSQTKTPEPIIGVCKYRSTNGELGTKVLMLDQLQDPGNIGTLIRTSLAFGIDTIVVSDNSVDIYNSKLIRSTQGAFFNINIMSMHLIDAIDALKKKGVYIIGTSLKNAKSLYDVKKVDKYAIILGNEGNGVRDIVLDKTDVNVIIPMDKQMESLNVSVAGGIIMNYFYQK